MLFSHIRISLNLSITPLCKWHLMGRRTYSVELPIFSHKALISFPFHFFFFAIKRKSARRPHAQLSGRIVNTARGVDLHYYRRTCTKVHVHTRARRPACISNTHASCTCGGPQGALQASRRAAATCLVFICRHFNFLLMLDKVECRREKRTE